MLDEHKKSQTAFLVEAYKTSISYYDSFAGRIWTRFSILMTVNSALIGLFLTLQFRPEGIDATKYMGLSGFGLVISIIMYVQSSQDKYYLDQLRLQINQLGSIIIRNLGFEDELPILFTTTHHDPQKLLRFAEISSWRIRLISTTRLPALISLLSVSVWSLISVYLFFYV